VRDFTDLSEGDYPWLDGVAAEIPYNNLTVTMEVKDCHFYLIDDWGSFESRPEFTADKLVGVGLYTSDVLSDGYIPVGMESADALADTFETLTSKFNAGTVTLWKYMSGWSRDQMMDAGAIIYFSMIKDFAHIAGVYDVDDWMTIDVRADRFRPLLNDEFGRDFLGGFSAHPPILAAFGTPVQRRLTSTSAANGRRGGGLDLASIRSR